MRRLVKQNKKVTKGGNHDDNNVEVYDDSDSSSSDNDNDDSSSETRQPAPSSAKPANAKTTGESPLNNQLNKSSPLPMMYADLEPLPLSRNDDGRLQEYHQDLSVFHSTSSATASEAKEMEDSDTPRYRNPVNPSARWYDDMAALMAITEKDEPPLDIGNLLSGGDNDED